MVRAIEQEYKMSEQQMCEARGVAAPGARVQVFVRKIKSRRVGDKCVFQRP